MSERYILVNGEPQACEDLLTWARWFEDASEERIVAQDCIADVRISTVFLGLDHSFGQGEPLLFETMIFGGSQDQYQRRYSTREAAVSGHAETLKLVAPKT